MENGWMIFDNDLQMVDFLCHWTLEGIAPSPAGFVRILIGKGHQFSMFSHEISIRVDEIHTKTRDFHPWISHPHHPHVQGDSLTAEAANQGIWQGCLGDLWNADLGWLKMFSNH